ncbi:S-layer homology domain-containing protein [Lysinibacillus fusiformis]|nr:S-layer homology domain-containing protein [Lysinibacillus fusiformis]
MKKLLAIITIFVLFISLSLPSTTKAAQMYSDVPMSHMYYDEITYLLEKGVIDQSAKFGVNDIVTREQVAVMIAKAVGLDGTPRATKFSDVPSTYKNSGYIQSAAEAGIINGYPDGTFKPKEKVTRGHMAAFIARAFDLPSGTTTFKDVAKSHTAYEAVKELAAANITTGYADGTFKPQSNLSRQHISVFLARAIQYVKGETPAPTPAKPTEPKPSPTPVQPATKYKNCTEMRKDYPNGVQKGHPAYDEKHDRDGDGWACER